jgi:hypothetical protein
MKFSYFCGAVDEAALAAKRLLALGMEECQRSAVLPK